jgi:hypothetical protein
VRIASDETAKLVGGTRGQIGKLELDRAGSGRHARVLLLLEAPAEKCASRCHLAVDVRQAGDGSQVTVDAAPHQYLLFLGG